MNIFFLDPPFGFIMARICRNLCKYELSCYFCTGMGIWDFSWEVRCEKFHVSVKSFFVPSNTITYCSQDVAKFITTLCLVVMKIYFAKDTSSLSLRQFSQQCHFHLKIQNSRFSSLQRVDLHQLIWIISNVFLVDFLYYRVF